MMQGLSEEIVGQPKTRSLDELRGALEHCYAATEAICADLSDDELGDRAARKLRFTM
jgi:hypothetical protein